MNMKISDMMRNLFEKVLMALALMAFMVSCGPEITPEPDPEPEPPVVTPEP